VRYDECATFDPSQSTKLIARKVRERKNKMFNIRDMISKGYRPIAIRSVSGKRDPDGRPVEILVYMKVR
jgi:hypothetical protein